MPVRPHATSTVCLLTVDVVRILVVGSLGRASTRMAVIRCLPLPGGVYLSARSAGKCSSSLPCSISLIMRMCNGHGDVHFSRSVL